MYKFPVRQIKKMQDRVQKTKDEVQKAAEKYEQSLQEINKYNPVYMEDMTSVFLKCQEMEETRLRFFKSVLFAIHKSLNFSVDPQLPQIYDEFHHTVNNADHQKDLKWWSNNHGVNMAMNWPSFLVSSPVPKWLRVCVNECDLTNTCVRNGDRICVFAIPVLPNFCLIPLFFSVFSVFFVLVLLFTLCNTRTNQPNKQHTQTLALTESPVRRSTPRSSATSPRATRRRRRCPPHRSRSSTSGRSAKSCPYAWFCLIIFSSFIHTYFTSHPVKPNSRLVECSAFVCSSNLSPNDIEYLRKIIFA